MPLFQCEYEPIKDWEPPFSLYMAGRGTARSRAYVNDVSKDQGPRRLLLKRTISGEGVLYVSGRRLLLRKGSLFIIERPGPYVYRYEENGEPWRFEYVSMSHDLSGHALPEFLRSNPVCAPPDNSLFVRDLGELIDLRLRDDYRPEPRHALMAYGLFLSYVTMRMDSGKNRLGAAAELRRLLIERHAEKVSIRASSRDLGYTQEALTRLFQSAYGIPPGRFLLEFRLAKARHLLLETNDSVKEIGFECGFNSQNYFSRAFRELYGVSPSKYRANPNIFG